MKQWSFFFLAFLLTSSAGAQNVGIGTNNPAAKLDVIGTLKLTDGTQGAGKVLTSAANGLASWVMPPVANTAMINFRFTQPNGNGTESSSNFWARVGTFIYRGNLMEGPPTSALALVYTVNPNTWYRLRIFDPTNAVVIATSDVNNTGTNPVPFIINLNTFSNLPGGQAVFEIQLLATDATGNSGVFGRQAVGIHAFQMYH